MITNNSVFSLFVLLSGLIFVSSGYALAEKRFDGKWRMDTVGGSNCPIKKAGTTIVIKNHKASGKSSLGPAIKGKISNSGVLTLSSITGSGSGNKVLFKAKIVNDAGKGSFYIQHPGQCRGKLQIVRM